MEIDGLPEGHQQALQALVMEARTRGCNCLVPMFLSREEIVDEEHWGRLPPENKHLIRMMLDSVHPHVDVLLDHGDRCPLFIRDWAPYN